MNLPQAFILLINFKTLSDFYPGGTNQLVLTLPPSIFGIIPPKKIQETNACSQALHQN
jgi:hypothetical protein